jgi:class 3 adenylate cyclase
MASEDALFTLVSDNVDTAIQAYGKLMLSAKFAALQERLVADLPAQRALKLGFATKAWCAILFVDMRGSTNRAEELGPKATYITMHALIPALAHFVADANGFIVGFRGDGLFACFGIEDDGRNPDDLDKSKTVVSAGKCGQSMVEAVNTIVNPVLESRRIKPGLCIGAGVDVGDVIFTKIGLAGAFEITAYANAVNRASKLANSCQDYVHLSVRAEDLWPTSPNGKVRLTKTSFEGHKLAFPTPQLEPAVEHATDLGNLRTNPQQFLRRGNYLDLILENDE